MARKNTIAPIFHIGQHCPDQEIRSIKISSFSEEACTMAEFDENHRHDYYEIIWLKKGRGVHNIDMMDYPYSGSVIFLLSPGQMHKINPIEKGEGFVVKFSASIFTDAKDMDEYILNTCLFNCIQAQPMIKLTSAAHSTFEDILNKMEAEFNADENDKEKILLILICFQTLLNPLR